MEASRKSERVRIRGSLSVRDYPLLRRSQGCTLYSVKAMASARTAASSFRRAWQATAAPRIAPSPLAVRHSHPARPQGFRQATPEACKLSAGTLERSEAALIRIRARLTFLRAPHQTTGSLPIRRSCPGCAPKASLHTPARSATRRRAGQPANGASPVLSLVRCHASYARDSASSAPDRLDSRSNKPQDPNSNSSRSREREHELSEAARKATQAHSGPEGHQKEDHHSVQGNNNDNNAAKSEVSDVGKENTVSDKEQTRRDWDIIKKLLPNVWPKSDWSTKRRVLLALGLLVGGKVGHPQT